MSVSECKICDNCKINIVKKKDNTLKSPSERCLKNLNLDEVRMKRTQSILKRLETKCLVCNKMSCDGETCMTKNSCFVCGGSGHKAKDCKINIRKLLNGKGCFSCWDLHGRNHHDIRKCPMKKRLKRLITHTFRSEQLEYCLERFYVSNVNFNTFMCMMENNNLHATLLNSSFS